MQSFALLYVGPCRGNGKENGNYYIIIGYVLGLYKDNGQENGNCNITKEVYLNLISMNIVRSVFVITQANHRVSPESNLHSLNYASIVM